MILDLKREGSVIALIDIVGKGEREADMENAYSKPSPVNGLTSSEISCVVDRRKLV